MPLTTAKARHITARIDRLFAGRSQAVSLTYGPGTVRTIQGIFRIAQTGAELVGVEHADAVLLIQARDIDFPTLRSVSLVKPTAATTQDPIATTYAITGIITNIPYHLALLEEPDFIAGRLSTPIRQTSVSTRTRASQSWLDAGLLGSSCPVITANEEATPRWVPGTPA